MPRIPGIPDIEPVLMDPRTAGRPGQAIAEAGQEIEGEAGEFLGIETNIREAQKHVDMLAAHNKINALEDQLAADLAKTQNSGDVQAVVDHYTGPQGEFSQLAENASKSPASVEIQAAVQNKIPDLNYTGTIQRIKLLGNEDKINRAQILESSSRDYALARGANDPEGVARAQATFYAAIDGSVASKLMGTAEANEEKRKFRQDGQTLQIENAIANPDPKANQAIYDAINAHPEEFPDVKPGELDALKVHALSAIKTHIEDQDWMQGQIAEKTMLPALILKWRNPATGQVDEGKALSDIGDQFASGKITETQAKRMEEGIKTVTGAQQYAIQDNAIKAENQIEQLISRNNFHGAVQVADSMRKPTEDVKSPWYSNMMKRIDGAKRQAEATYRATIDFDEHQKKYNEDQASQASAFQLLPGVVSGQITDQQLTDALGSRKINYKNYLQLTHTKADIEKDPDTKKALNVLYDAVPPPPKTASDADKMEYDNLKWNLFEQFQQGVGEKNLKGDDKTKYAVELAKPFVTKDVADRLDKLFSQTPKQPEQDSGSWWTRAKGESWDTWLHRRVGETPASERSMAPKEGDTKTNSAGDSVVFKGGKWQSAP